MKKLISVILVVVFLLLLFTSCDLKCKCPTSNSSSDSIVGYWKWLEEPRNLLFRNDGTCMEFHGGSAYQGTYEISGSNLTIDSSGNFKGSFTYTIDNDILTLQSKYDNKKRYYDFIRSTMK